MSESLARLIDHALLHPLMTDQEIVSGCELAKRLNLKSVCVKPYAIPLACQILAGSATAVGTVIGFPHGSHSTAIKAAEAQWSLTQGAEELDMVVNVGKAHQGDWEFVAADIRAVVEVARRHSQPVIVKVIFETDFLTDDATKVRLCQISEASGADFVKTSTGFGFVKSAGGEYNYVGATLHDIQLMRASCQIGVKASGGVRDYHQARQFQLAGATRLGTSASQAILAGAGTDTTSY